MFTPQSRFPESWPSAFSWNTVLRRDAGHDSPHPAVEAVDGLSLVSPKTAEQVARQNLRPTRAELAKLRTYRQRLPLTPPPLDPDRIKSAGLLALVGRAGPTALRESVADTRHGPWSRVAGNVVALVANEDRLHRYPQYVVDFLGTTLGIGHLFQFQRQHPGLVNLTRWFFQARSERPAIVVVARAKPLASAAVAEKRGKLIELPVEPSFVSPSCARKPVKFPYNPHALEIEGLRFVLPAGSAQERNQVRPVIFDREREIAGTLTEFSRERYFAFGVPEAHDEMLAKGHIPGLHRFWQPRQRLVDAPNMIFAVLPGPGDLADVRDLYGSSE